MFNNITENTWDSKGNYKTEFADEIDRKILELGQLRLALNEDSKRLTKSATNTKLTNDTVQKYKLLNKRIDSVIRGLQDRKKTLKEYKSS